MNVKGNMMRKVILAIPPHESKGAAEEVERQFMHYDIENE